ncbi:hypothetical protein V6N13_124359 [Hibiscus sabdariffa]
MDTPRGRRGRRPARGRGRGRRRRADVILDTPVVTDPPPAPIGFQQVGGDAPPVQDPPVVDPPAQDPPRAGGSHLEAPRTTISERLLAVGASFFDGVSVVVPNLAELWLDHTDRVLDELDYLTDQRLRAYTTLLKDQAYNWRGTV